MVYRFQFLTSGSGPRGSFCRFGVESLFECRGHGIFQHRDFFLAELGLDPADHDLLSEILVRDVGTFRFWDISDIADGLVLLGLVGLPFEVFPVHELRGPEDPADGVDDAIFGDTVQLRNGPSVRD